jgi:hydrocephalus-inducing protein
MEVSYVIRFKPDARIDYSHDLVVITEREKFSVPIRASGGSALLDFPDRLDFGADCVVGHQSEKTVLVRNIGDRATKFVIKTSPPFSVAESDGYLPEGGSCQVDILFKPERQDSYEGELHLKYGELEAVASVYGAASNAEVVVSTDHLIIDDTYVGLETQGVVIIRNNSDVPVDFSWRLFPTIENEEDYRLQLQGQLKHEEREENLYMMQDKPEDESSDESGSDEERLKVRREGKIGSHLSRKYRNIHAAVREDPMLFHDATFSIEPSVGKVWSQSR